MTTWQRPEKAWCRQLCPTVSLCLRKLQVPGAFSVTSYGTLRLKAGNVHKISQHVPSIPSQPGISSPSPQSQTCKANCSQLRLPVQLVQPPVAQTLFLGRAVLHGQVLNLSTQLLFPLCEILSSTVGAEPYDKPPRCERSKKVPREHGIGIQALNRGRFLHLNLNGRCRSSQFLCQGPRCRSVTARMTDNSTNEVQRADLEHNRRR